MSGFLSINTACKTIFKASVVTPGMVDEKRPRGVSEVLTPPPAREIEKIPEAPKEAPAVVISEKPPAEKELPGRSSAPLPASAPTALVAPVDEMAKQIEAILEEDMAAVYVNLPADVQPKFKAQGEYVARTISAMIEHAKVKTRKVLKLIIEWLRMIPGVNKFFLEQEAAIKAQKIIILAEEEKKR